MDTFDYFHQEPPWGFFSPPYEFSATPHEHMSAETKELCLLTAWGRAAESVLKNARAGWTSTERHAGSQCI